MIYIDCEYMGKIDDIIREKGLKPKDCSYHTIRALENNGRIRGMVIKGDNVIHIEYTCPKCGHKAYKAQEYKKVSKAAMYRFSTKCDKCGFNIKVEKLKGGKKKKKEE